MGIADVVLRTMDTRSPTKTAVVSFYHLSKVKKETSGAGTRHSLHEKGHRPSEQGYATLIKERTRESSGNIVYVTDKQAKDVTMRTKRLDFSLSSESTILSRSEIWD